MSQANTPGVGPVLERYDLPDIPEAHCYVTYRGQHIDITSAPNEPAPAARVFSHEEPITPDQIEEYKPRRHREFLAAWIADGGGGGRSLDEVWKIREECIAALSPG